MWSAGWPLMKRIGAPQVLDVLHLYGVQSGTPYVKIDRDRVELPMSSFAAKVQNSSTGQSFTFLNRNFNIYHPATPV